MQRRVLVRFGLVIWACASAAQAQVRVEAVEAPSAGARAGIRPGDRLISWTRTRDGHVVAQGRFLHGFDARPFEIEQLPKGGAAIAVSRQGAALTLSLGPGLWGITTGPALRDRDAERYRQGLSAADKRDIVGAWKTWGALAEELSHRDPREAVWLYCRIGTLIVSPVKYMEPDNTQGARVIDADLAFERAQAIAGGLDDPRLQALAYESAGAAWRMDVLELDRASLGRVRKAYGRALQLRENAGGEPLGEAATAQALGMVWAWYNDRFEKPDIARARELYAQAVSLRHLHAGGSFEEGYSRLTLALLLFQRFPDARQEAWREVSAAVMILECTAPGSHTLRTARVLAGFAADLGNHRRSNQLLRLAVPAARHTSVDSDVAAMAHFGRHEEGGALLASMARVHLKNGNLQSAAAVLRMRAVLVSAEPPVFPAMPPQQALAGALSPADLLQFARAASASGNTRAAAAFYRQLMSKVASTGPPSSSTAGSTDLACLVSAELVALGEGSQADGDRVSSGCQQWTTGDARERNPYAENMLCSPAPTGAAARGRRRLDWRNRSCQRDSGRLPLGGANALWVLGEARCAAGQRGAGIAALVQAHQLLARAGKQTTPEMLTVLGQCERDAGNLSGAERWLVQAIGLSEAQSANELTAYMARAFESSASAGAYSELAALLVRSGRPSQAFQIVEAGRARALRRALSERAVPQPPLEEWQQRMLAQDQTRRAALWQDYSDAASAARSADGTPAQVLFQSLRSQTLAMELN